MDARCYIAILVFAALSTVLGYMIFHRLKKSAVPGPSAAAAPVATAATPLLGRVALSAKQ